ADASAVRASLGGPLPQQGEPAGRVVEDLARHADPGLVATAGPRYFGFVVGGSVPAALGADWLTSAWDQNAGLFVLSPAAAVVEETVFGGLRDLFSLPGGTGMGFVRGGQMASTTCLAAARQAVLARSGWDVAAEGLNGAPRIVVLAGDEAHVTVHGALRLLGLGDASVAELKSDGQGRMLPDALRDALRSAEGAPVIVCAQAGNVNTGSFDPLRDITRLARAHPPLRRASLRGAWSDRGERSGAQSSSRTLRAPRLLRRGRRRLDPAGHLARAERRHVLALGHGLARADADAHLGVQLEHGAGGRRAIGGGDPGGPSGLTGAWSRT